VTLVRVKPGMDVAYLRDLAANWKHVMDDMREIVGVRNFQEINFK